MLRTISIQNPQKVNTWLTMRLAAQAASTAVRQLLAKDAAAIPSCRLADLGILSQPQAALPQTPCRAQTGLIQADIAGCNRCTLLPPARRPVGGGGGDHNLQAVPKQMTVNAGSCRCS